MSWWPRSRNDLLYEVLIEPRHGAICRPQDEPPHPPCRAPDICGPMPPFLYRCPNTGYRVQGFVAEDVSEDPESYEAVTCTAVSGSTL